MEYEIAMKYLFKIIFKLTCTFYVFSNKLHIYLIEIYRCFRIYLRFYLYVFYVESELHSIVDYDLHKWNKIKIYIHPYREY